MIRTIAIVAAAAATLIALSAQAQTAVPASRFPSGTIYLLPATLETTQWGWFDNA